MQGNVAALPAQHMQALAKATRRRTEIAEMKKELRFGALSAKKALTDPRAVGRVTVSLILISQRGWGERKAKLFLRLIGAPEAVLAKQVQDLTERQIDVLRRGLEQPFPRKSRSWW